MDVHGPDEDFESIPWESFNHRDGRPAWQPAALGVAIGAALMFLVLGSGSDSADSDDAAPPPSPATSIETTRPPEPPAPSVVSEADLMAVESFDLETAAGRAAERFLADFFTIDEDGGSAANRWIDVPRGAGSPADGSVVVDGVEILDARRVDPDRVVVVAEVRRSLAGEPETVDRTSFEVEVAFGDTGARIVDLPRPVRDAAPEVPPEVLAAGAEAVAPLVADEVLASEVNGDVWRLVIGARDRFGMVWPLAVTVDAGAIPGVPGDQEK